MKKTTFLIFTLLALALLPLTLYAHDEKEEMKMGMGMMEKKGGEGKEMMGKHMMMKMMMEKSVTATSDGGVVIVSGNKITKYDKDLNLVKEIETKMDMKAMEEMMGKCPMMKDKKAVASETTETENAAQVTSAAETGADDHAAHH